MTRRTHALIAALSGLLVPALLFVIAATLIPLDLLSFPNASFWGQVAAGCTLAALWIMARERTSLLAAVVIGVMSVVVVLLAVGAWSEYHASTQLEHLE